MRLTYHPDAETELIEAASFYEGRVPILAGIRGLSVHVANNISDFLTCL